MALLSHSEAIQFLQDVLKMDSIPEKFTSDKASLLNEIINQYQQKIPFQTITVISRPDKEQRLSTMDDIKTQIFSTQGGLCYDQNIFFKNLLEALGYEVCLNACDVYLNGVYSHVSILATNLIKPGDKYYVNVRAGNLPFFRAISLDFEKQSPDHKCGYLVYRFEQEGEELSLWHKINKSSPGIDGDETGFIVDGWKKYMVFTLEPREIEFFAKHMMKHFVTAPTAGISLLQHMRANVFPNQKLLAIHGTSLLLENNDGIIEKTKIRSRDELLHLYAKYFPQIPADMVEIAADKMKYNF